MQMRFGSSVIGSRPATLREIPGPVSTQTPVNRDPPLLESLQSIPPYDLQLTGRTGLWPVSKITRERIPACRSSIDPLESCFPVTGRETFCTQLLLLCGEGLIRSETWQKEQKTWEKWGSRSICLPAPLCL